MIPIREVRAIDISPEAWDEINRRTIEKAARYDEIVAAYKRAVPSVRSPRYYDEREVCILWLVDELTRIIDREPKS